MEQKYEKLLYCLQERDNKIFWCANLEIRQKLEIKKSSKTFWERTPKMAKYTHNLKLFAKETSREIVISTPFSKWAQRTQLSA